MKVQVPDSRFVSLSLAIALLLAIACGSPGWVPAATSIGEGRLMMVRGGQYTGCIITQDNPCPPSTDCTKTPCPTYQNPQGRKVVACFQLDKNGQPSAYFQDVQAAQNFPSCIDNQFAGSTNCTPKTVTCSNRTVCDNTANCTKGVSPVTKKVTFYCVTGPGPAKPVNQKNGHEATGDLCGS